ncbi:MAG TPA: hypothetical protein VHD32_05390 [Candidatus Didemnitutus sp.]|nr:hypothetical protein [Candidatus Didemnitutus sp.]
MGNSPAPSRSDRGLSVFFIGVAVVALWELTRSWHASILDRYEFRQLQTALSTYWMVHDGWHLNYLTPLFGPPWSIPMEFPTYQMCIAWTVELTGLGLESAGRLVSVLFFLGTLPAVYDVLAVAGLPPRRRLIVLCFVLCSPVYLFYARTFMIETAAVFFAVWFVASLRRSLAGGHWLWIIATILSAVLAALTKITTFVVFCPPAATLAAIAIFRPSTGLAAHRSRGLSIFWAALPVALALAVGLWWVQHSDDVKNSNPFSGFLTSTDLHRWNYGDFGLRFDTSFWRHLQETVFQFILSEGGLVIGLVAATLARPAARVTALACLAGFLSGPLIFSNLYHIHDYYYTANGILLVTAAGLLLASAWDNERLPGSALWTALILVTALQLLSFDRGYGTYHWRPAPPPPEMGVIVRETVPADGVVLIYGADWNPLLPYYSERRAVMVPGERENETAVLEQILARLPPRKIAAMITVGKKFRERPDFIAERTARFGLAGQPVAEEGETDLYLPPTAITTAAASLAKGHWQTARLLVMPDDQGSDADWKVQRLAAADFSMVSPAPERARSKFGISTGIVEGRNVINAHAPSEITVVPPTGAREITAIFGLPAAAYDHSRPAVTDGIDVEILEEQAGGLRRSLWHRHLDPATNPADRGPQTARFESPVTLTGHLIFHFGPGPAGNITNDWAYWSGITVR